MKKGLFPLALLALLISTFVINGCSKNDTLAPQQRQGGGNDSTGIPNPPPTGVATNVVYGSATDWQGNKQSLTMDIHFPTHAEPGKLYPLVVYIHGGGFVEGDKSFADTKCQMLADSGFVAATINYRLGWDNQGVQQCHGDTASLNLAFYRAMQDAHAAIRYLVANSNQYIVDPNWIFVAGNSAGGATTLLSTYITDDYAKWRYPEAASKLGPLQTADNDIRVSYTIKGLCSIAGGVQDSMIINASNAVPTIFFQGEEDAVIPVNGGYYLGCTNYPEIYGTNVIYRQLIKYNTIAVAHLLPNAGHGNNGESGFDDPYMMSNTSCFFHSLMQKGPSQTGMYIGLVNSCK